MPILDLSYSYGVLQAPLVLMLAHVRPPASASMTAYTCLLKSSVLVCAHDGAQDNAHRLEAYCMYGLRIPICSYMTAVFTL
jgi:hypothetical protein